MNIKDIIENIFNNKKIDITIDCFLNILKEKNKGRICWKIQDNLILLYSNWKYKIKLNNDDYISKYFNCTIIDNNYNLIMYSGSKIIDSIRDDVLLCNISIHKDSKYYESYEGTNINVYYYNNKWFYSTKRNIDMYQSYYNNLKSHGNMFDEIINKIELESLLNKDYTYQFIMIHDDNNNILKYNDNRLILLSVRDKLNNFKLIDINLVHNKIYKLKEIILEEWDWNDETKQGIILYNNDNIYKFYNKHYKNKINNNDNNIFNKQIQLITNFKNNLLVNDDKILMINLFNILIDFLFYIYMNNITTYDFIIDKNINKLYYIYYDKITKNLIKNHIKFHMDPYEIFTTFNYFKNNYYFKKDEYIEKFINI